MAESGYLYVCSYRCTNWGERFDYTKDVSLMPPLINGLSGLIGKFFAKCPNCGSGWGQFKKVKYTPEGIFSVSLKPIEVSKKRVRLRPFRRFDEAPILPVDDREKEK